MQKSRVARAEADVDLSERFFERIFNSLPHGICVLSNTLRYLYINDCLAEINGRTAKEHIGRSVEQMLPEPLKSSHVTELRHVVDTGDPILGGTAECKTAAHPNVTRNLNYHYCPIQGEDGSIEGVICSVQDVTVQKQMKDYLQEREARLHAILETSLDSIITINEQATIESVNAAAVHQFLYERRELIGKNVGILSGEPEYGEHYKYLKRYLETGEAKIIEVGREVICRRKDGTTFPAELSVAEAQVAENRRIFIGTIRDLTARKNAEALLQKRQTELSHVARLSTIGEMAAGLTHELNQPLGAISNYASNCLHIVESGDVLGIREDLQEIIKVSHRCGEIIRRVKGYTKKRDPHRSTVEVSELIADVLAFVEREAHLNEIAVQSELPAQPLHISVDTVQIQQVLLNLTRNAIDAIMQSDRRPRVLTVAVEKTNLERIVLSVRDTGDGIREDVADHLFEAFVTTKSEGLGMGLAVSKSIVESHGGSIELDTDPGRGTTVRIILPGMEVPHEAK